MNRLYHKLAGHVCVSIYGDGIDVFNRWAVSVHVFEPGTHLTVYWTNKTESKYEIRRIRNLIVSN